MSILNVLLFCTIFSSMLCSTTEPSPELSIEDTVISLRKRMDEIQQQTMKQKEDLSKRLSEVETALQREHSKVEMLEIKENLTRILIRSHMASQRDVEEVIRKNITSASENLRTHINERLLESDNMQSNFTKEMRRLENSLLKFENDYANASYVSSLDQSFQNLDEVVKSQLQFLQNELSPRVKQLEEKIELREDDIKEIIRNHISEILPQNTMLLQDQRFYLLDYTQCGLDLNNLRTNTNIRQIGGDSGGSPAWPWMAALYMTEGRDPHRQQTLRCGGTVIHQNFVLTAAHCVDAYPLRKIKAIEITVKLGLTNLSDVTHLQQFQVRAIHIHPKYQYGLYDYDTALLELEKPIKYNHYIRPVCLPPREIPVNSQLYKPQSHAKAIGWGHQGVVHINHTGKFILSQVLKEIDLIILSPEACKENLRNKSAEAYFTDRMFCAAEEKYFTCVGDTGGPAMQSQLSKEGYRVWTQVGIINWGTGCGLKNEFVFFTHLQKLMPWVNATIEAALKG